MRRTAGGFSLIEVMVVMAIIAIGVAVASLAIPSRLSADEDNPSAQLFQWISDCADEARLSGQVIGLRFKANGRDSVSIEALSLNQRLDQWASSTCFSIPSKTLELSIKDLSLSNSGLAIEIDNQSQRAEVLQAHIILLPTGEITPFNLEVFGDYRATIAANGFDELVVEYDQ
ncbi:MAG: prepilin-type N-terminal cleavage/methylation domain-containing protein [Gammaproteobacteria bacterium]|nr:prepilin-type N-terminal cleavage/methylation domain-containing protein [Gammaproteobacteria bacterium]